MELMESQELGVMLMCKTPFSAVPPFTNFHQASTWSLVALCACADLGEYWDVSAWCKVFSGRFLAVIH